MPWSLRWDILFKTVVFIIVNGLKVYTEDLLIGLWPTDVVMYGKSTCWRLIAEGDKVPSAMQDLFDDGIVKSPVVGGPFNGLNEPLAAYFLLKA